MLTLVSIVMVGIQVGGDSEREREKERICSIVKQWEIVGMDWKLPFLRCF